MAEPAPNLTTSQLVSFHMNQIRNFVSKLHDSPRTIPEATYEMDISWHPASKQIAQEVIAACRAERMSATYEPPRKEGNKKYLVRLSLQRIVCSQH